MATFEIQTPGGGPVVVVSAQDEAQALEIARQHWQKLPRLVARRSGGRVVEGVDGTRSFVGDGYSTNDTALVERILQGESPGAVATSSQDQQTIRENPTASALTPFVRGAPFVGSRVDELLGATVGPQAQEGMRAVAGAMERERPLQTAATSLAGTLTGAAGMTAAAPGLLTRLFGTFGTAATGPSRMLPQIARAAAGGIPLGAVEGAVYGSGEGTDKATRDAETLAGAGFGAAGGALGGLIGPLVGRGAENALGMLVRSDIPAISRALNISADAARVIKQTFEMGGDFEAARRNLQRAGDEGMLVDAGEAAQALADATAAAGGPAGTSVRQPIEARAGRVEGQLTSAMDDALGAPADGPRTAVEEIRQRTAPARNAAYDAALGQPVDYSTGAPGGQVLGVLGRISPRLRAKALRDANDLMLFEGVPRQALIRADGTAQELYTATQLHYLKMALGSMAESARGAVGQATPASRLYGDMRGQLAGAMDVAIPGYREATALGGDKLAEERAFLLGQQLLSPATQVEDVLLELGQTPSYAALEAARRGLRTQIDKIMGDVVAIPSDPNMDARQALAALRQLTSDNARAKITRILGFEQAGPLLRKIEQAQQTMTVRAALSTNSRTAVRQATNKSIEELTAPGVVGQALAGEPINTTKALIQAVTGQTKAFSEAARQRLYLDIAKALTEKRGKDAQVALRYIEDAITGQPMTEAQNTFVAQQLAGTLFGTASAGSARVQAQENRRTGAQ